VLFSVVHGPSYIKHNGGGSKARFAFDQQGPYAYRAPVVTRESIVETSSAKADTAGWRGWGRRPHARPDTPRAGVALPLHEPQATDPATAINRYAM